MLVHALAAGHAKKITLDQTTGRKKRISQEFGT